MSGNLFRSPERIVTSVECGAGGIVNRFFAHVGNVWFPNLAAMTASSRNIPAVAS